MELEQVIYKNISSSIKDGKMKPALIPFIVSGHPDLELTKELLYLFQDFGAAAVELGIPFSDPLADGPVIQEAAKIAISNGVNIDKIFNMLKELKVDFNTPVILFSYVNPILSYGVEKFIKKAGESNIAGLIIPDLPIEESDEVSSLCKANGIDQIMLIAPTSDRQRIEKIAKASSGFIYLVSSTGVTGVRDSFDSVLSELVKEIKEKVDTPVSIGFGISKAEHINSLKSMGADGAIIGSALVKIVTQYKDDKKLLLSKVSEYLESLYPKTKVEK